MYSTDRGGPQASPRPTLASLDARLRGMEAQLAQATPLGRNAPPEDCVGAYLFLASSRMSGFITGQVIEVNGGILMP